eukprot:GHVU01021822.1.p1 GENE.GHVU01021822.1~~GHVU01021822.1.p1  ORF type:complete len:136 (+),score=7.77 GHVU01021822.1:262-669(+)
MVFLFLRRCHNFASQGDITIRVVPPTQPDGVSTISCLQGPIPEHVDPAKYANAWSNTLKSVLEKYQKEIPGLVASYTTGGTWENSGLTLYMMTVNGGNINWYSLSKPDLESNPTEQELKSKLGFLVTGTQGTWPR